MTTATICLFFFFNDTATTEIYTLSYTTLFRSFSLGRSPAKHLFGLDRASVQSQPWNPEDRKSTRLNSSHQIISYAVFCLKKKKRTTNTAPRQISGHNGHTLPSCVLRNRIRQSH